MNNFWLNLLAAGIFGWFLSATGAFGTSENRTKHKTRTGRVLTGGIVRALPIFFYWGAWCIACAIFFGLAAPIPLMDSAGNPIPPSYWLSASLASIFVLVVVGRLLSLLQGIFDKQAGA